MHILLTALLFVTVFLFLYTICSTIYDYIFVRKYLKISDIMLSKDYEKISSKLSSKDFNLVKEILNIKENTAAEDYNPNFQHKLMVIKIRELFHAYKELKKINSSL